MPRSGFLGWRMVALGFLAQNLALGLTFGSFGVLIKPVAADLDASRGAASLGIALILVLMGIAGPVLGVALTRYPIRRIMMLGALAMAAGFAIASQARGFSGFLVGYSLIGGAGCAALGVIPSTTLVSNWFVSRIGLAIGLLCMPLLVGLAPPLVMLIVDAYGWRVALLAQAGLLLAMLPLLSLVVSRPEDVGQHALGAEHEPLVESGPAPAVTLDSGTLLRSGRFWGVLIAAGLLTTGGIVITVHVVPFATDQGIGSSHAAWLQSVNGISAMGGALLFGWVADRIGSRQTLGLIALLQATLWSLMLLFPDFNVLIALLVGIGLCGGATQPVFSALLSGVYGQGGFARALGLATLLMMPFTFAAAPLAGWLFDLSGSYTHAFQVQIGAFAAAAIAFLVVLGNAGARSRTPGN
ncbi:MAG: MFS transporter [Pseudomonadales bacterium]|nr:MFS transporter [Pseudomonadales bacterium]